MVPSASALTEVAACLLASLVEGPCSYCQIIARTEEEAVVASEAADFSSVEVVPIAAIILLLS